jgi:hypothetical protein
MATDLSWPTILLGVGGWLGVQIWTILSNWQTRKRIARLEHLKNQIEQLYGPVVGINRQCASLFELALRILPHTDKTHIAQENFNPAEKHIEKWRFLVENYFLPLNSDAASLLKTEAHLLDNPLPPSFGEFLDHTTQFEALHMMWKKGELENPGAAPLGFPSKFTTDLEASFYRIMNAALHAQRHERDRPIMLLVRIPACEQCGLCV